MKDKSSYKIIYDNPQQEINSDFLMKGLFLWVMNWKEIPPHLGCSWNGNYFSLTVKGIQKKIDVIAQFRLLNQRQLESFFVEVDQFQQLPELVFNQLGWELHGETTCLAPLIDVFSQEKKAQIVAELLQELSIKNRIKSIHSNNIEENWCGVRKYEKNRIFQHIENLNYADVKR